jgi:hypothetical protein
MQWEPGMQWLGGLEGVNRRTSQASGSASLTAGSLTNIRTRALTGVDHICGIEGMWYPPLWSSPVKRSAYLGMSRIAAG